MLGMIICLILFVWLFGLLTHIGGGLVHLLLVMALVAWIANMIRTNRN